VTSPAIGTRPGPWSTLRIEQLSPSAIWRALWTQSPAIWLLQFYILFEYVRPQTIYPVIDIAPWSQIFLLGAVLAVVVEGRLAFTSASLWLSIAVLTVIVILSSITSYYPEKSWADKNFWINWLLLMLIVGAGIRTRRELLLFLIAFGLWNLKMSQHAVKGWVSVGFSFRSIGIGGAPGWFQNSGEFGIEMCVFLPISVYFAFGLWPKLTRGKRLLLLAISASALFSIVASSSRGALLGAAAVGGWALWRNPNRLRAFALIIVLAPLVWLSVPEGSKARFRNMGEDKDSITRITYWKDGIKIANQHPLLGIGYRNWLPYYTTRYNPKGQLPHNFMIEAVAELGYVGAIAVLVLIGTSFGQTSKVRKLTSETSNAPDRLLYGMAFGIDGAMIGFIVSGSFVSVLYYPYLWMNIAMVMALVRVESERRHARIPHAGIRTQRPSHTTAMNSRRWRPSAA
jgi:putative inorganic carbon (HCO3(-)) transporter